MGPIPKIRPRPQKGIKVILRLIRYYTLFEIFIFCPNIQLWFAEKMVIFSGWNTRENVVVMYFLAVDNFDFTRKNVKKIWGENSWKCWGFVKIEFLDKNLTFLIVWSGGPYLQKINIFKIGPTLLIRYLFVHQKALKNCFIAFAHDKCVTSQF